MDSIKIYVCLSDMKKTKKYKDQKTKEIVSTFCAVLNSQGGRVTLELESGSANDVKNFKRTTEQRLSNLLGFSAMCNHVNLESSNTYELTYTVSGVYSLCTMNYNLYVPSETQIIAITPKTQIDDIRDILSTKMRIVEVGELVERGTHHKEFVLQQSMTFGLPESKTIQLKYLKAQKSKRLTLGDRMTNKENKFARYVSGFANHHGGHVYYGVQDDGVVIGEFVEDKERITKKVSKAINKIVWPLEVKEVTKGDQWDIFFEPVKDNEGRGMPSTYVIVVYIASCDGGVFTEEPESYHIVDSFVTKMTFQEWKERILGRPTPLPRAVERGTFSTTNKEKLFYTIMEKLMDLRNAGQNLVFMKYVNYVNTQFPDCNMTQGATLSQEATVAFRTNNFSQAKKLIKKYDSLNQGSSENMLLSESMGLYIKSANLRAQGNYQESYELAKMGLQTAVGFSPGLIQAWFYTHTAMLAIIIAAGSETDPEDRHRLVVDAKVSFKKALDYSQRVTGFDKAAIDLQQKIYIQLAHLYLGSSLSGSMVTLESVSEDDVKSATNCLMKVQELITDCHPLSPLREVQYLMAHSSLFLRQSQQRGSSSEQKFTTLLQYSLQQCEKALVISSDNNFDEMIRYCRHQKAVITEEIIRNSWPGCSKGSLG